MAIPHHNPRTFWDDVTTPSGYGDADVAAFARKYGAKIDKTMQRRYEMKPFSANISQGDWLSASDVSSFEPRVYDDVMVRITLSSQHAREVIHCALAMPNISPHFTPEQVSKIVTREIDEARLRKTSESVRIAYEHYQLLLSMAGLPSAE